MYAFAVVREERMYFRYCCRSPASCLLLIYYYYASSSSSYQLTHPASPRLRRAPTKKSPRRM